MMNNMNNNKTKDSSSYKETPETHTAMDNLAGMSTTQKYMNNLLKGIQADPSVDDRRTPLKPVKYSVPTCHTLLMQKRSLQEPPQQQQLVQVGNKFKPVPPPPPLNIKNRFGSTTELAQQTNRFYGSEAEEIARELQIVKNISSQSQHGLPFANNNNNNNMDLSKRSQVYIDYNDVYNDDDEYEGSKNEFSDREEEHLEMEGYHVSEHNQDESIYSNFGEAFKIARPTLSRTTSVGRLVNNFEQLEETRSLAGDVQGRQRSPPLTRSQRRLGTLTRQRTHLGIGVVGNDQWNTGEEVRDFYDGDNDGYTNRWDGPNETSAIEDVEQNDTGWGSTRQKTGPGFRGPTTIWNGKFFVPPTQPKPPVPSKPMNRFYHSVGFRLYLRMITQD